MRNNKGFSMIELIIIIALISIILSVMGLSLTYAFSNNAKGCATQANSSISKLKVNSLSRAGKIYTIFEVEGGNIVAKYYENGVLKDETVLSDSRVVFSFTITDGGTEVDYILSATSKLILAFDRTTGGFKNNPEAVRLTSETGIVSDAGFCSKIEISAGSRTYTIKLAPSTGGHELEG